MAKFHAQIWQFCKLANISETAAGRVKISSILTPWGRKRLFVQVQELWPIAKMVLKQSVKAHRPLVFFLLALTWDHVG